MLLCPLALIKDQASLSWATEYICNLIELQNIQLSAKQKLNILETLKLIQNSPHKSLTSFINQIGRYALKNYTEEEVH